MYVMEKKWHHLWNENMGLMQSNLWIFFPCRQITQIASLWITKNSYTIINLMTLQIKPK
jgi:hypothetical protein